MKKISNMSDLIISNIRDRQEELIMSGDNEVVELSDADLSQAVGGTTTVRDAHDRYSNTDRTGDGRHC